MNDTALLPDIHDADALSLARSHSRMQDRWRLRALLASIGDGWAKVEGSWDAVPFARTAGCGRVVHGDQVEIRETSGRHYVAGVATCGSVWVCPVCEAKIRTGRAVEMRELAAAHVAAGGTIGLLTLTVRHAPGDRLDDLLSAQTDAWKSIQDDDRFRALRRTQMWRGRRDGKPGKVVRWIETGAEPLVGTGRAVEVTQGFTTAGDAGSWHPHQHVVMFWRDGDDHADDVAWIAQAWADRIEQRLGSRPSDTIGFDYRPIAADNVDYVSKISDEITRADLKGGSRTVWALLELAADGDQLAMARFMEYVTAMRGRRSLHLSHGLRARYALEAVKSDDELAATEVGGELVRVIGDQRSWSRWMWCAWGDYPPAVDLLIGLDRTSAHNERSFAVGASP